MVRVSRQTHSSRSRNILRPAHRHGTRAARVRYRSPARCSLPDLSVPPGARALPSHNNASFDLQDGSLFPALVDAWRRCSDSRVPATSADETGAALLPQLVRMKFTTSTTSLSVSRQANPGIVNCAGVWAVRGVCDPSRTMEMSDCGFSACTTGLPARLGNTRSYPTPSGRWHAAQLFR
jgi:hypothetical protein